MLEIVHTPYGQEHPYEQLPEERFPRQPLANEPFMVGIVTRPAGTANEVTLHYLIDDLAEKTIAAEQQIDWQQKQEEGVGAEFLERLIRVDQDVWRVQLTAPLYGQTLIYWLEAEGATSERFVLHGEVWQTDEAITPAIKLNLHTATSANAPTIQKVEWLTDSNHKRRVRLTFPCKPDERFFGLGERFNALNQRGNIIDVRVYEQYKNHGQRTYMPIPFLLSSAGYGIYVESNRWMQFDLAATAPDCWMLEVDLGTDETCSLHGFTGNDPVEIIAQFTQMTGPAALPPEWAFGLWMSSNEWNSQARVEQEVAESLANGIQPAVLVIEAWSDETTFYIWNDADYMAKPGAEAFSYEDFTFPSSGKWPDPKGMVDRLHAQGIKVLLWQIPILKVLEQPHAQHQADHEFFENSGFGVREPDGSLHKVRPFWFRGGYIWDVTNTDERKWWLNKRAYLLDEVGIDGFKTDGGEHLWGAETRFADGRRGDELWNQYPERYTAAYYDFAKEKRGGITFSRAGYIGSQHSPLHWAGDENSTWEAFRHSILAGLNAAVSGIPFWGWDFAGFSGAIPTVELYLRAAAMAVFCPVMQYHSEYNPQRYPSRDRTPWNIQALTGDEQVIPVFKQLMAVRERLLPYIWKEAQHTASTGEAMMRPLQLWYKEASPYQYYFGRDLLICPIVEVDVSQAVCFLPPGEWVDFWTNQHFKGGEFVETDAPLERIPVFRRNIL
ncbi:MAG: hypothetical protein H7Y09_13635 [Chitinophagaceae bacterium]|nr:hypothetical protein [Anaerolineae bacterium]